MIRSIGRLMRSDAVFMFAGRAVQYAAQIAMVLILPKVLLPPVYTELNLVLPVAFRAVPFRGWSSGVPGADSAAGLGVVGFTQPGRKSRDTPPPRTVTYVITEVYQMRIGVE